MISKEDREALLKALELKTHFDRKISLIKEYEDKFIKPVEQFTKLKSQYAQGKALVSKARDLLEIL